MKMTLRAKLLLVIGGTICSVLGASTYIHIRGEQSHYREDLETRSQEFSHKMLMRAAEQMEDTGTRPPLDRLAVVCEELFETSEDRELTQMTLIDGEGSRLFHSDHNGREGVPKPLPPLDTLPTEDVITLSDAKSSYVIMPIFWGAGDKADAKERLGILCLRFSTERVGQRVAQILRHSAILLGILLVLTFPAVSVLMHLGLTAPVKQLALAGEQLAAGDPAVCVQCPRRHDDMRHLRTSLHQISEYLRNLADVASHIAAGRLDRKIPLRSEQDLLGKAVEEILQYLQHAVDIGGRIAGGDLTAAHEARSPHDAFGRVFQGMTEELSALIMQIKASSKELVSTGSAISSFTERDFELVERVTIEAEHMTSAMQELGKSIEDVADKMESLSTSIEQTSSAVSQVAGCSGHIASKTDALANQTNQAIMVLKETEALLDSVVDRTEASQHLSQGAIRDALDGQDAVEQVMASMETIQATINMALQSVTSFAQRSRDIDSILDVIRHITEQTSLLALNASIIAAQAGDHGRGFAVVADEITQLASGVGASTKEIATIVNVLQEETNAVVETIYAGANDAEAGIERTQEAREKLETITNSVRESSSVVTAIAETADRLKRSGRKLSEDMLLVNTMTDEITTSTIEQEASTTQINEVIRHIAGMTLHIQQTAGKQSSRVYGLLASTRSMTKLIAQNRESSQQIADTAESLFTQAELLSKSVERFKVKKT